MVEFNLAGWSALLGAGVVAGGVLWLIGLLPVAAFPVGVGGIWGIAVMVDWVRERESLSTVSYGDGETVQAIHQLAVATGVPVELVKDHDSEQAPALALLVKDKDVRRLDEIARKVTRD